MQRQLTWCLAELWPAEQKGIAVPASAGSASLPRLGCAPLLTYSPIQLYVSACLVCKYPRLRKLVFFQVALALTQI